MKLLGVILISITAVTFYATGALSQTCPGMVSYWKFDEGSGTTATDYVGTNPGTLINSPVWTTGKVIDALNFNGSNYVSVEDSESLDITNAISLEAWIYPTNLSIPVQDIISKHASPGGYQDAYCLQVHTPSLVNFVLNDGSAAYGEEYDPEGYVRLFSSNALIQNQWSHVVGTWDGNTMKIYINGVQDPNTIQYTRSITNSPLGVGIGRNGGDGWYEFFHGTIDEAAIYNRALTPEEVQQHYQNGLLGLGYCEAPPAPPLACQGFEPPMDIGPVTVKKNRVLPLKSTLLNNGVQVTNLDIVAPPVIQVIYTPEIGDAIDVTQDVLAAGLGTEGNQFVFDGTWWHFNLETKNYTAPGTYRITMISGDETEYTIDPTCSAEFVIE